MSFNLKDAIQLHQNNKLLEAKKIYLLFLENNPLNYELLTLLGTLEYQLNNYEHSKNYLKKSLEINEEQFLAHQNIGIIFSIKGNYKKSIKHLKRAIELNPNYYHSYNELAQIYMKQNQYEDALIYYNQAISINPNYFQGLNNRAACLRDLLKPEMALVDLNKAIQINPDYYEAYLNRGNCLKDLGKFNDAQKNYEIALSINKDYEIAKYNLSILHLLNGNFKEGWRDFDSRWFEIEKPSFSQTVEIIKNIHTVDNILLWGEQGIGDQIIFISLLGELSFIKNITVAIDPRLIPIYKRSYPTVNFINLFGNIDASKFKYHLPLANLGCFLRNSKKSFSNQPKSFLITDLEKKDKIKKEIRSNKIICGISWKSKNKSFGIVKSVPLLSLIRLFEMEQFNFVDLQYDSTKEEKDKIEECCNTNFISFNNIDKFNDIDGLLSLIAACDIVVTSCNITAHLAGAIGKKTFLMIPFGLGTLWYWHGNSSSYWYPTINLYKQKSIKSWDNVVDEIIKDLKDL